ncbi:TetR/AcrR family transcriptional regulator [Cellulosilyticum sp. I15G10I2]|uniref:TetR/AcrR family transcriptional regulator n=1 Tax=Cellulosilyticum sp. I15G10I2 TaxID=1892843 RepID=UPI00085BC53C|nr:TetR/AcrR family transcriptional regulator [Cellulosilyticum sp. I15G10I2]
MATQSEIKYNRLMEKAEELFINLGYRAVSMEDIAETAGISKMTIYKHFASKEDLFIEVVLSLMNKTYILIEEEMSKITGILKKIDYLMQFNKETSKNYSIAFYKDCMSIPYVMEKLIEEKYNFSKMMFGNIIKEGMEKGEIRKVNVDFMTEMLIMILEGITAKYSKKQFESREEIEGLVENFYDFLKYGLLGGDEVKK